MSKNIYLVLHDFTPVGDAALNYAVSLSRSVVAEIKVVNLVSNKSQIASSTAKLDQIIANTPKADHTTITSIVKVGSIFNDIAKIVKEEKGNLIIMGTHGKKGVQQNLFGSFAMKVITSSNVPFIVTQINTKPKEIAKVLVPIDLEKESLQVVDIAGDIAKIYNAEVILVAQKHEDPFLSQKIKNRILIVRKQYEDRDIVCHIELLTPGGAYHNKVMDLCKEKSVDLIAISYHTASFLPQFDKFAQSLITNVDQLPCVIINSKQASSVSF